jgi:hypothetical protein
MKIASLLACVASLAMIGCNADPHPSPGMSAVTVKVVAQPKIGTAASPTHVASYDGSDTPAGGTGAFARVDYSDLHDVVVWLETTDAKAPVPSPAAPVTIDLKEDDSTGAISGVAGVGQTIVFRNATSSVVAAYSVSDGNEFNLGTIPPGGSARTVVKSAGLIEIVADSVKEPLARVYAAPTCWVTLAQSGSTVAFNDVPPGHYRVVSWHPRLPGSALEIDLAPDRVSHSSIDVGVNHLPKIQN